MTTATVITNPLLDAWHAWVEHHKRHGERLGTALDGTPTPFTHCTYCPRGTQPSGLEDRNELARRYSWAIPHDEALDCVVRHSPRGIVEIGAGSGYWAHLLNARGVEVAAYDRWPPGCDPPEKVHGGRAYHHAVNPWHPVLHGGPEKTAEHPEKTLMLSWPPYGEPMAADALDAYRGDTLIYVGESAGGCTGDDRFHDLLGDNYCWECAEGETCERGHAQALWEEIETVAIPRWFGINDWLTVYRRRTARDRD